MLELKRTLENFQEDKLLYKHNMEFLELVTRKDKKEYERLCKRLKYLDLPDPHCFLYSKLKLQEIKDILKDLLLKILGTSYEEELTKLLEIITKEPKKESLEATLEIELKNGIYVPEKIYISSKLASIEICAAGHEIIHALLEKYVIHSFNQVIGNIHYKEELSILIEYILCYELSILLKEENLIEKHQATRLFYLKGNMIDKDLPISESPPKKSIYLTLGKSYLDLYEECQSHEAYGYLISCMYGTTLLQRYKEDRKSLQNQINQVIKGSKSLIEMNQYYNLSLGNEEMLSRFQEEMNKDYKNILKP